LPSPAERSKSRPKPLADGTALRDLLPRRLRPRLQPLARVRRDITASPDILLTGTQVAIHNALVAALLEPSALILLTGAAGLGKTSVLAAAIESISNPSMHVIQLDKDECGMDESFKLLFTAAGHEASRPGLPERRMVLVADQAETLSSGTFSYLELLTRMPGKHASVQLVIVGRPEFRHCIDGPVADRFQEAVPIHLVLSPLSDQDAWDLFHHRVSSVYARQSVRRMIMMLLERSGGVPGRFDEVLKAAITSGLLEGAPA